MNIIPCQKAYLTFFILNFILRATPPAGASHQAKSIRRKFNLETWKLPSIFESNGFNNGRKDHNKRSVYERHTESKTSVLVTVAPQTSGHLLLHFAIMQTYSTGKSRPVFKATNVSARHLKPYEVSSLLEALTELAKSATFCQNCKEAMCLIGDRRQRQRMCWNCPQCSHSQPLPDSVAKTFFEIKAITKPATPQFKKRQRRKFHQPPHLLR